MGLFQSFDISASGLTAQRLRMDVISNNLANVNTTRTEPGDPNSGPYKRKVAVFEAREPEKKFSEVLGENIGRQQVGRGVRVTAIKESADPTKLVYNPEHPDAIKDGPMKGYVQMPNINVVTEMVDMISATRAYEANVSALRSTKDMMLKALEIGR
jgi:flagellar basal-body rod protein FlgC